MKRCSILFVVIACLLSSCVAAVMAGAAAGVIVYDRRSLTMLENDARIFHVIHKSIVSNPQFQNSHIEVISFNRVVLLVGETEAASLKVLAERIAQKAGNVRRVYNELTIGPSLPITSHSKDAWLTGQIRTQMLARSGLESGSIRIATENGVVYLMGIVTREEANLAVDVARQVNGVVKVVKVFQYIT